MIAQQVAKADRSPLGCSGSAFRYKIYCKYICKYINFVILLSHEKN
jgi:hypothetical protein